MHCFAWSVRPHYGDDSSQLPPFQIKHVNYCNMFIQKFSVFCRNSFYIFPKISDVFHYYGWKSLYRRQKIEWFPLAFASSCPQVQGRHWLLQELGDYFHLHFLSQYSYLCSSVWFQWLGPRQELLSHSHWLDTILTDYRVRAEREEAVKSCRKISTSYLQTPGLIALVAL